MRGDPLLSPYLSEFAPYRQRWQKEQNLSLNRREKISECLQTDVLSDEHERTEQAIFGKIMSQRGEQRDVC